MEDAACAYAINAIAPRTGSKYIAQPAAIKNKLAEYDKDPEAKEGLALIQAALIALMRKEIPAVVNTISKDSKAQKVYTARVHSFVKDIERDVASKNKFFAQFGTVADAQSGDINSRVRKALARMMVTRGGGDEPCSIISAKVVGGVNRFFKQLRLGAEWVPAGWVLTNVENTHPDNEDINFLSNFIIIGLPFLARLLLYAITIRRIFDTSPERFIQRPNVSAVTSGMELTVTMLHRLLPQIKVNPSSFNIKYDPSIVDNESTKVSESVLISGLFEQYIVASWKNAVPADMSSVTSLPPEALELSEEKPGKMGGNVLTAVFFNSMLNLADKVGDAIPYFSQVTKQAVNKDLSERNLRSEFNKPSNTKAFVQEQIQKWLDADPKEKATFGIGGVTNFFITYGLSKTLSDPQDNRDEPEKKKLDVLVKWKGLGGLGSKVYEGPDNRPLELMRRMALKVVPAFAAFYATVYFTHDRDITKESIKGPEYKALRALLNRTHMEAKMYLPAIANTSPEDFLPEKEEREEFWGKNNQAIQ